MAKLTRGRCWCCGNEYLKRALRCVRYELGKGRIYNYVCSTCQDNVLHAKEEGSNEEATAQ